MSELVKKLAQGSHPVVFRSVRDDAAAEFKECIDRDYVHILFTETRGGTELGMELDRQQSDLSAADLENGTGKVHLVGGLSLDYVKVRCIADLDLKKMAGKGRLEVIKDDPDEVVDPSEVEVN